MATRRMLSKTVVESDPFFEMPADSQALYMHLVLNADDDGFIGNPETIRRMTGFSKDSLKLLIAKGFLISFQSGVIVVTHWEAQNKVQPSRKNKTIYTNEKQLLYIGEQGKYLISSTLSEECQQVTDTLSGVCQQDADKVSTQVRLGKVSIGKCNNMGVFAGANEGVSGANEAADKSKKAKPKEEYSEGFKKVWEIYDCKKDKKAAYNAYKAQLREGYTDQELLTATRAYIAECKKENRFVKWGKTFFGVNTPFVDYLKTGVENNAESETEEQRQQRLADEYNAKYGGSY